MDSIFIGCLVAGGVIIAATFVVPAIKKQVDARKAAKADGTTADAASGFNLFATLKLLFTTTEKTILASTPVRSAAVSVLIHFENVVDALPSDTAKVACHDALKTLITNIGDPTPLDKSAV